MELAKYTFNSNVLRVAHVPPPSPYSFFLIPYSRDLCAHILGINAAQDSCFLLGPNGL